MQNAPREHSAILSTFIKLPFVSKTFVLSIFVWLLKTGSFVVYIGLDKQNNFECKIVNIFLSTSLETVLLSTHNICFGLDIRKLFFNYTIGTDKDSLCT